MLYRKDFHTQDIIARGTHAAPDISGVVKEILDNTITGETIIESIGSVEIFESHGKLVSTYTDSDNSVGQ